MDRIRLLYIDYSDWYGCATRIEGHSPEDMPDDDGAVWPSLLYALDDRDRCLAATFHAGCLRIIVSETEGAFVLLDACLTAGSSEIETDASDWLFPNDRFNKSLLLSGQKCWCGCAFVDVRRKNVCLRCNRTDAPYPRAIKIHRGSESEQDFSVNVGNRRIDIPAGHPFLWWVEDNVGSQYLILHFEGMEILARPSVGADDRTAFEAVSWSRSGYWGDNPAEDNPDLPLEDFAVSLGCLSQWRERLEFDHLRCDACSRLRHDKFGPCCHCGHTQGEQLVRENFLPTREKIRIIHIGECDHLSMWFRELYDVDGNLYHLYHRGGNMYAFRVEDEFILFDRKQGGPYDGAGSNEVIMQQTADVFEFVGQGIECEWCGALYPHDRVPENCYVCQMAVRFVDGTP